MLAWGQTEGSYENQLAGVFNRPSGHNYVVGFGLLPNLELAARLATNENNSNCFGTIGCGTRDLSASAKASIPLDRAGVWHVAAGATDLGGSITYFRSYYGAITAAPGPWELTAGLASRSGPGSSRGSRSPLDGPFASAAWSPVPLARVHLEYTDRQAWAGLRLFAPAEWLPTGWTVSLGVNQRLTDTNLTKSSWWNASVAIPLYQTRSTVPQSTAAAPSPGLVAQPAPGNASSDSALVHGSVAVQPQPVAAQQGTADVPQATGAQRSVASAPAASDAAMADLAQALQDKGLEDIWIGRLPDGVLAIRAENGTYAWNTADAIGAALGVIARRLSAQQVRFSLVITQRQLPLVGVTGRADCLRTWIETGDNSCAVGQLSTAASSNLVDVHAQASWVVERRKPSWRTVRLTVSPVLRTRVGTEVGALDYDLAANVNARLPLWNGASVEWGVNSPLARTSDFGASGVFRNQRIRGGTDRLVLTQLSRIPVPLAGAVSQFTAGRIGTYFDGALGEIRWEPGEGQHRVSGAAGWFRNNDYQRGRGPLGSLEHTAPAYASYRYRFSPTRTDVEVTAGRFLYQDRGVQLTMRQWFDDVAVGLFYKRSSFASESARQLAGIELSLPIGPRRDWSMTSGLQVGGSPRFTHALETSVREPAGGNPLRPNHVVRPPTPGIDATLNSDRTGLRYFEDNVHRIRQMAR